MPRESSRSISDTRRSSSFAWASVSGILAGSAERLSHSSSIRSSRSSGLNLLISISSLAITRVWHFPCRLTRTASQRLAVKLIHHTHDDPSRGLLPPGRDHQAKHCIIVVAHSALQQGGESDA